MLPQQALRQQLPLSQLTALTSQNLQLFNLRLQQVYQFRYSNTKTCISHSSQVVMESQLGLTELVSAEINLYWSHYTMPCCICMFLWVIQTTKLCIDKLSDYHHHHHTTTVLRPFFRDHPGELVPEENFGTLWWGKINRGRHTDHQAGRHSIQTNQCPPPPSPHFLQAGCLSCRPTNSVKALKATSALGLGRRR